MASYPCAACGFLVFAEPPGSFEICPVCGWEDDHVQLRHPGTAMGANGITLAQWQRTIALPDAPLGVKEQDGFRRATGWRPLTDEEARAGADGPQSGRQYFDAAVGDAPPYYWEAPGPPAT